MKNKFCAIYVNLSFILEDTKFLYHVCKLWRLSVKIGPKLPKKIKHIELKLQFDLYKRLKSKETKHNERKNTIFPSALISYQTLVNLSLILVTNQSFRQYPIIYDDLKLKIKLEFRVLTCIG